MVRPEHGLTGDLGYWVEGDLFVTGRQKDVIIKAGRNLYPQEVEDLAGEVPGIRKGCVAWRRWKNERRRRARALRRLAYQRTGRRATPRAPPRRVPVERDPPDRSPWGFAMLTVSRRPR